MKNLTYYGDKQKFGALYLRLGTAQSFEAVKTLLCFFKHIPFFFFSVGINALEKVLAQILSPSTGLTLCLITFDLSIAHTNLA